MKKVSKFFKILLLWSIILTLVTSIVYVANLMLGVNIPVIYYGIMTGVLIALFTAISCIDSIIKSQQKRIKRIMALEKKRKARFNSNNRRLRTQQNRDIRTRKIS